MNFRTGQKVFDINFGFGVVEWIDNVFEYVKVIYETIYEGDSELVEVYYDFNGSIKHGLLTSNIPTLCIREYLLCEIDDVENINLHAK